MKTLKRNELKQTYIFSLGPELDALKNNKKISFFLEKLQPKVFIDSSLEIMFLNLFAPNKKDYFNLMLNAWLRRLSNKDLNLHFMEDGIKFWILLPVLFIELQKFYKEWNLSLDDFEKDVITFWLKMPKAMEDFVQKWELKSKQLLILEKSRSYFFEHVKIRERKNPKDYIIQTIMKNSEFRKLLLHWANYQENLKDLSDDDKLHQILNLALSDLSEVTLNYIASYQNYTFEDYHKIRSFKAKFILPMVSGALSAAVASKVIQ